MVSDVLARSAGAPGSPALVTPARSFTYAELGVVVRERADALAREGLSPGGIVPFTAAPDGATVVELLAIWSLGAIPAPLNAGLTGSERAEADRQLASATLPEGAQAVLWTSGTAGRPRGVVLSMANLEASTLGAAERLELGANDVWLASLSPAHVGGLVLVVRSVLLGSTLLAAGAFDAAVVSGLLDGSRVGVGPDASAAAQAEGAPAPTHMSLVPTQLLRLLDHRGGAPPPASFRCALIGGAHAPARIVERAHAAGWPLALTYGATEMTSQIATAPPDLVRGKPGTVGRPLPDVEVRLDGAGQLLVRGPTMALALIGEARGSVADPDGWYHTGDLARVDEDGHLWIIGRRLDRIVSGGVTVDAVEIEEALRALPSVLDACAVGVADPEWGERVGVWIHPVAGEFDPAEVETELAGVLSAAKLPRVWYLGAELPRNANGKVDRRRVREALEAQRTKKGRGRDPFQGL